MSPATTKFLQLVVGGLKLAGYQGDLPRIATRLFSAQFASQLLHYRTPAGGRALLKQLIQARPEHKQIRAHVDNLWKRGTLSPEHHQLLMRALNESGSLDEILLGLPVQVVQYVLKTSQEAMEAFFNSWSEDMRVNAELDEKAAQRSHQHLAEQNRQDAVYQDVKIMQGKVSDNRVEAARQNQRVNRNRHIKHTIFAHAVTFASTRGHVPADYPVGVQVVREVQNVVGDDAIVMTSEVPTFEVPTLINALMPPEPGGIFTSPKHHTGWFRWFPKAAVDSAGE